MFFFFGACRKTISSTCGYVPVFDLLLFTKAAKPISEPVDQSVLRTICRISRH